MKSAWRLVRLYARLQLLHIRIHMEYRLDFWIGNVGMVLRQLATFIFIWALFSTIPEIEGWTLWEVAFLYGLIVTPQGLVELFGEGPWRLRWLIYTGRFDLILTRPLSPVYQVFTQASGVHGLGNALLGLAVMSYALTQLGISWQTGHSIYLGLILLSSTILFASINLMTHSIAFWDPSSTSSFPYLIASLNDFAKFPVTLFGSVFQFLFTWILPFAFISYYPALLLLNRPESSALSYVAPLSGWLAALVASSVWRWAMRHYQGVGH